MPVLFNLHGGAWVGGDAVLMDSFCTTMADRIPALVVNVNYTKIDVQPFPNPQLELCDVVLWFAAHAGEFGADPKRFAVGGHSAGAHISAGAALRLKELGFSLAAQMLVYPFTDFRFDRADSQIAQLSAFIAPFFGEMSPIHPWLSPLKATDAELSGLAPAIFVVCGLDELKPQGIAYAKRLIDVAVPVRIKEYPQALHGFLEVNRPEYEGDARRSPEQLEMTIDCERFLAEELRACFALR